VAVAGPKGSHGFATGVSLRSNPGHPDEFDQNSRTLIAYSDTPAAENGRGAALRVNGPWTGWRGPHRDALVNWLPASLPEQPNVIWRFPTSGDGLAGVAATPELVIIADRDVGETQDIWRCLDAELGLELWNVHYDAAGDLDYGNSPRATPLIQGDYVYLQGAFGHLLCVELGTGEIAWQRDLTAEFNGTIPNWGYAASPLIVDDMLIVNPAGPEAFLVALDPGDGSVIWKTPGGETAYASFVVAEFGGVRQLVGYDKTTLGGWSVADGRRLWQLAPEIRGDFNVPTPMVLGNRLLVATENNGTRLYAFDDAGVIKPRPLGRHTDLGPDSSTPVVTGGHVYGVWNRLYCLDASTLEEHWSARDRTFWDYASLITGDEAVLITTTKGELYLVADDPDEYRLLAKMPAITDGSEVHSHPALVGTRLFIRSATGALCVELRGAE
jgi:outer membrane protein assembly factor BamB